MKVKMDVSIIIVNYNTLHVLLPCLDSIMEHTHGLSFEIIVVDNGSIDGSVQTLQSDGRIRFVSAGSNLGFGKANNLGLSVAKGQYILFLNSDTLLTNNAVGMMYDFSCHYEGRLGALGAVLVNRSGQKIHSFGKFPRMRDDFSKYLWIPLKKALHLYRQPVIEYPSQWAKVDYVTGADLFVNRQVLDECGAFHPAFFMYCEESEMEYRFHLKGYDNIIMNGPGIIHLEGEGGKDGRSSKFLRDTIRQQKSEYIYYKLTEPRFKYYLYRIIHPVLRQTVWFNPNISMGDKWQFVKQLFVSVKI
ncbi:MAG: glycosyltransferase family 2 protein [Bacteroidaceae bacterium]|nr:glycosyltransferase family 2 protein [Bacteroidaceae bacterium]